MFERLKAMRARMKELAEIDALTEGDLIDLGLSRDQMRALIEIPKGVTDRVAAMAAIFGISDVELAADRSEYVDVLCNCKGCRSLGDCGQELSKGDMADPENCGFCVNAGTFADHARRSAV
jgi:hypothetical protein